MLVGSQADSIEFTVAVLDDKTRKTARWLLVPNSDGDSEKPVNLHTPVNHRRFLYFFSLDVWKGFGEKKWAHSKGWRRRQNQSFFCFG